MSTKPRRRPFRTIHLAQLAPLLWWLPSAAGADRPSPADLGPPLHTFSIVARDAKTGQLGVAVQTHWFNVGSLVPWAEAGVGAVATQSFVNPAYGPRGLELMRKGTPATEALGQLIKADPAEAVRQVAMVDSEGRVAAHTGARCIEFAAHRTGAGYSVQANMMISAEVVPAMAGAYEAARGEIAERLLAALEAAQAAGGDIRGQQSAALLVVKGTSSGEPWRDIEVQLRVEDHPRPLQELRRLLDVDRAYRAMRMAEGAVQRGDVEEALKEIKEGARLAPGNLEVVFWPALRLADKGHLEPARPLFERIFHEDPRWRELVRRLPKAGVLSDDEAGRKIAESIAGISGLRLTWENNMLAIRGAGLPGGKLEVWYLEAYCRSGSTDRNWQQTVIPHRTRKVSESADGRSLKLECSVEGGVQVVHEIRAGDDEVEFQVEATNRGASRVDAVWVQPCVRLREFTGLDQEKYIQRSFIFVDGRQVFLDRTRRTVDAIYRGGQVYVPAEIDRRDVNPRPLSLDVPSNGLIGCISADGRRLFATAWEPYQELFQGVIVCLHSDFRLGGLAPGETKRARGKIYLLQNDPEMLLSRYRKDFPAQATNSSFKKG